MFKTYLDWIKKNVFLTCSYVFTMMIIVLAIVAAAHVGYSIAELRCAIEHGGSSAPQNTALFLLIPYGLVEIVLFASAVVTRILHIKAKSKEQ